MPQPVNRTFAPFVAAAFVMWPILAYMGGQGFVILVILLAIAALFHVRPNHVHPGDMPAWFMAAVVFLAWSFLSFLWHENGIPLIGGNLSQRTFSVNRVEVSFTLTVLATTLVIATTRNLPVASSSKSLRLIGICVVVQAVGILATTLFSGQILNFLAPFSHPAREMPQNLLRNINAFALLLPWLVTGLWKLPGSTPVTGKWLAIFVIVLSLFICQFMGSQSAVVGLCLMIVTMAVLKLYPRHGFRILFSSMAAYVICAPVLFHMALGRLGRLDIVWPKSFFARINGWDTTIGKIGENPLFGHGLKSSYKWHDVYADHPELLDKATRLYGTSPVNWAEYKVVNGHPHNMPLQIWLDTGMIGALLAAVLLVLLGMRLDRLDFWSARSRYAAVGLVGVCISLGSFAYSVWNIAYWSGVTLACALIILQARQDSRPTP